MNDKQIKIGKLEGHLKELKLDLGEVNVEKNKSDMHNHSLNNFITTQASEQTNAVNYLDQIKA